MDAYRRKVAAKLAELRAAGEHEKANELEKAVKEIDRVLGRA